MKRAIIAVALAASSHASAETFVVGSGLVDCGTFAEYVRNDRIPAYSAMEWVNGWLSRGQTERGMDVLSQTTFEARKGWVANYCQANPLDKLIDAAKALERELEKRSGAKR